MRNILIVCALFVLTMTAHAQYVYYGYPRPDAHLYSGVLIVANIPLNVDGRFKPEGDIRELINFLNRDTTHVYEISLYLFGGNRDWREAYVNSLAEEMLWYLNEAPVISRYSVDCSHFDRAIFLDADDPRYIMINTRMEILVK